MNLHRWKLTGMSWFCYTDNCDWHFSLFCFLLISFCSKLFKTMNPTHFLLHLSVVTYSSYFVSSLHFWPTQNSSRFLLITHQKWHEKSSPSFAVVCFRNLQIVLLFEWLRNKFNILHLQITNLHADAEIYFLSFKC